jgi:hypothetical protein
MTPAPMKFALRLAVVAAMAFAVAGCDKCGNWPWQKTSCSPAPVQR